MGARGRGHGEAQVCYGSKVTRASDFLQEMVAQAVSFGWLNPKATRSN